MTGAELRTVRHLLGLSVIGLARRLGWQDRSGGREIRRMENGTKDVPDTVREYLIDEMNKGET